MGQMNFLEKMGNRWWPIFGAVFLVSAIKRQQGMRLIGPASLVRIPAIAQLTPAAERSNIQKDLLSHDTE
jgi:hypothetical protein